MSLYIIQLISIQKGARHKHRCCYLQHNRVARQQQSATKMMLHHAAATSSRQQQGASSPRWSHHGPPHSRHKHGTAGGAPPPKPVWLTLGLGLLVGLCFGHLIMRHQQVRASWLGLCTTRATPPDPHQTPLCCAGCCAQPPLRIRYACSSDILHATIMLLFPCATTSDTHTLLPLCLCRAQ